MQILEDLRSDLLTKVSMLHKLIDNFALLDMLSAFHGAIQSAGGQYVKPSITSNGPLAIQQVGSIYHDFNFIKKF